MASSKSRQRALARAKTERQIARRAASARRRRRLQGSIGIALVVILGAVGAFWATGGFEEKPPTPDECAWTPVEAAAGANQTDVGRPPTKGIPKNGSKALTMTTNQGVVSAVLDLTKAPCTSASISFLAGKNYFNGTTCHRVTDSILQCGDPSGTGSGGPAYRFPNENVPQPQPDPSASADPSVAPDSTTVYPRGTLAMAHSSQPDSNGSQFFIVYKDVRLPADYTIFGTVTGGLDVVEKIGAGGSEPAGDGKPKVETKIDTLTVTDNAPPAPAPTASAPSVAPTPSG